jgi:hypothetical protein
MGTCLPSAGEVLIIRPAGKKGQPLRHSTGDLLSRPCQEARHSKQDPKKCGSRRNAVAAQSLKDRISQRVISRDFKEPY